MPRSTTFEMVVPGSPKEVARRLRAQTRWRPFPYQTSVFGGGKRPLGGLVSRKRFAVSLDDRDFLQRMTAVARAKLEPAGAGTRVVGVAGMPTWLVWDLRLVTMIFVLGITAVPLVLAITGGAGALQAALFAFLLFLATGIAGVLGIGLSVSYADERVDRVVETVERALQPEAPTPESDASTERTDRRIPRLDRA